MGVKEAPVEEGRRSPDRVLQVVTGPIKSSEPEIEIYDGLPKK